MHVFYFIPVLCFGMIQLSTYKMKPGSSSMDHFLEPTWTRPVGHFCLPLHYSLPTAPSAGRVPSCSSHILPSFRSSPPKREKQHTVPPDPHPYTHPTLPQGPGPSAPSTDRSHTALLAHRPTSWGRCLLENTTLLFPQYDLKGKFIFPYQLRQKMQRVLRSSLQIASFY